MMGAVTQALSTCDQSWAVLNWSVLKILGVVMFSTAMGYLMGKHSRAA